MTKIKSIEINLPMKEEWYAVGHPVSDTRISKEQNVVTEIKDVSIEFENSIDFIYDIYISGQLYASIQNTPVTVIYEIEGEPIAPAN